MDPTARNASQLRVESLLAAHAAREREGQLQLAELSKNQAELTRQSAQFLAAAMAEFNLAAPEGECATATVAPRPPPRPPRARWVFLTKLSGAKAR